MELSASSVFTTAARDIIGNPSETILIQIDSGPTKYPITDVLTRNLFTIINLRLKAMIKAKSGNPLRIFAKKTEAKSYQYQQG